MSKIGFNEETAKPCPHFNNWGQDTFDGVLFHKCFSCGKTWALAMTDEGVLYWERVREEEEVAGAKRAGVVHEEVQPVPGGEGAVAVRKKSKPKGRPRPPVQDVPPPLQLDTPAEEGEGVFQ